jgi:hypothetical protein
MTFETIKTRKTLWGSNKRQQMNIPGMGRVECQRIGLGSLVAGGRRCRIQHCGSEQVSIGKNENYEKVKAFFSRTSG